MRPVLIVIACVFALLIVPTTAVAGDDAPYSPKLFSIDELIVTDRFDTAPLAFPWEQISMDRVSNRDRLDFEIIYDVDYDRVREFIEENHENAEDFVVLEPGMMRYLDNKMLRVRGRQLSDDHGRITVGHPDLEPMFTVDIEADGARTRFVIHNTTRSRQFSGFVPARVEFAPMGADLIPFRWN